MTSPPLLFLSHAGEDGAAAREMPCFLRQHHFPGHPLLRGPPSPDAVPPECPPSRP